jgi:ketosteroid isomerase-like protein
MDIAQFNRDWLAAWSDKDVPKLLEFYSNDVQYRDPAVPQGLTGQAALKTYLTQLFANTPPMRYEPETVWPIEGGFCGRWYCTIDLGNGKQSQMRGFDLCRIENGRIVENEVYTHNLPDRGG